MTRLWSLALCLALASCATVVDCKPLHPPRWPIRGRLYQITFVISGDGTSLNFRFRRWQFAVPLTCS